MNRFHYVLICILIAVFACYSHSIFEKPSPKVAEIHYHAGFEIYKDGKLMNFTDLTFMDVKPCGPENDEDEPHKDFNAEVHLHDGIGNVVHIHGKEAQWKDLFKKLNIDVTSTTIGAYFEETPQALLSDQPIKPYQRAVFFILSPGEHSEEISESHSRMPVSYIKEIEKKGENCSK